jgi:hypothetical protein
VSIDKNVFSVCVCADPWCREHGCRLATQQRYGPQTNYAPVLTALPFPSADAVAEERAAVVAMLRARIERHERALRAEREAADAGDFTYSKFTEAKEILSLIERGEHRREEGS